MSFWEFRNIHKHATGFIHFNFNQIVNMHVNLVSLLIELKPPIDHHLGSELQPQQDLKSNKKVNSTKQ